MLKEAPRISIVLHGSHALKHLLSHSTAVISNSRVLSGLHCDNCSCPRFCKFPPWQAKPSWLRKSAQCYKLSTFGMCWLQTKVEEAHISNNHMRSSLSKILLLQTKDSTSQNRGAAFLFEKYILTSKRKEEN